MSLSIFGHIERLNSRKASPRCLEGGASRSKKRAYCYLLPAEHVRPEASNRWNRWSRFPRRRTTVSSTRSVRPSV